MHGSSTLRTLGIRGYPKPVSWIHSKAPKQKLKASDLLTPAEVKKLISVTPDMRLKALIAVCYECGLRVGEALQMRLGDVELQAQCATLTVSGKTGRAWPIRSNLCLC
jgi:integrase